MFDIYISYVGQFNFSAGVIAVETIFHHTGSVVQSGGEICRHREGAGTEEDAAGGLPARHLQPHDP